MLAPHIAPELREKLFSVLTAKRLCRLPVVSSSATAFLALGMIEAFRRTVVVVADSMHTLDELRRNLMALAGAHPQQILYYPAWESLPGRKDGRQTTACPAKPWRSRDEGLPAITPWAKAGRQTGEDGHQKQATLQPEVVGERLQALALLSTLEKPAVIATCVQALMQLTLAPHTLASNTFRLTTNGEYDRDALANGLLQTGYTFEAEVQFKGQAARRGGLLDVWPPTAENPLRIEFFGSKVETIRAFDPADQRSKARLKEAVLLPADEWSLMQTGAKERCAFMDHLRSELIYLWSEPLADDFPASTRHPSGISNHAALYEEALAAYARAGLGPAREHSRILKEANLDAWTITFAGVCRAISENPRAWQCLPDPVFDTTNKAQDQVRPPKSVTVSCSRGGDAVATGGIRAVTGAATKIEIPIHQAMTTDWPPPAEHVDSGFQPLTALAAPRHGLLAPDVFAEQRRRWLADLAASARAPAGKLNVHMFFHTQGALDRFRELHPESVFHLHLGMLSDGFICPALQLAVLSESNLLGRPKVLPDRAPTQPRKTALAGQRGATITDWTSLQPGDLVVHVDHGIGRYLGLYEITFNGKLQEALAIEYDQKAKLYVPVSQAHLLSRYIGVGKHAPPLHRLGSTRWSREKNAAERAVHDLAASLLEIQAIRESMTGFAFPPDTAWQHEFEAAFPYQETEDQDQAIQAVKRDMQTSRPMDRLVCGDVGYGKTEVAMRAAFKCVMSGKQVAVLAPTTVLAQQHFEVFAERMAAYPIRVELLCRFRTLTEQQRLVQDLAAGKVDIVIGTHRLIQPDVRFKDLGLLIIDEEQRFGVGHKEHFKQQHQLVDVLTLTATPIPRTLYLSLTGAREISMIQTAPKARQSVATIVTKNEDHIIREAILRELNRGGQVYYLHNRVHSIERVRARLEKLVPEARIAVGHGQMPTSELAHIVRDFAAGDYEVLLCTTIIESGLDIPNVNTIIIDRADRFGMADLYQLRGRVGRSSRQAYAYLLLPVHGHLLDGSRQRIQAILEHTALGASFRLALRDLEIRGAGNLLGTAQSGHIAAIGFDLYCQLLRYTIANLAKPSRGRIGGSDEPHLQFQPAAATPGPLKAEKTTAALRPPPTRLVAVEVALDFIDLSARAADRAGSVASPARLAFLPVEYVEDERLRLGVYRQIASAMTLEEIAGLREEFHDRFGPVPEPLNRLLKIAALRIQAAEKKITMIEVKTGKLILHRGVELLQLKGRFPRLRSTGVDAQLDEIRHWLGRVEDDGFSRPSCV